MSQNLIIPPSPFGLTFSQSPFFHHNFFQSLKIPKTTVCLGAFTQIVWKETRKLGVGITSRGKILYVVCFYEPRGNIKASTETDTELIYHHNVLSPNGNTWNLSTKLIIVFVVLIITAVIIIIKLLIFK